MVADLLILRHRGGTLRMTAPRRLLAWVFATVLAANLLLFSGTVRSADGGTMLAVTRSLATRGAWDVPPGSVGKAGQDGRLYAQYGPACSVAALPLFLVGHGAARLARLSPERTDQVEELAVALFNPMVVALIAVLVALAAAELGVSVRGAVGGGLLCAFGTGLLVQMKDFNSEPLTALLFLGAFYLLLRQRKQVTPGGLAVVGALAGAAILTRPANALGAALLGLAALVLIVRQGGGLRAVGRLACFAVPVLVAGGLYAWYNYARFGNPLDTGYHEITFNHPLLKGLWLQLFSLERGLLWYDPVVLLAPFGAVLLWRQGHRGVVALAAALTVAFVLLYSTYAQAPAGGHSMGQRFLLVVMPLLVLLALPVLDRLPPRSRPATRDPRPTRLWTRLPVIAIIAASVLVQLPLIWISPSYYYARLGAEREAAAAPAPLRADQALLIRAWPLAVEVTREALQRPDWVRSLPLRTSPSETASGRLPGPRSFHVPYFWWALAWAYRVPALVVWAALLANLSLILSSARGLALGCRREGSSP